MYFIAIIQYIIYITCDIYVIGKASSQQWAVSRVLGKSEVIHRLSSVQGGLVP